MELLIEPQALQAHLDDYVILDVRHQLSDFEAGRRGYEQGHIPQAIFLDHEQELAGPKTGLNGRHPLPDRVQLAQRLADLGITLDRHIVVYDEQQSLFAVHAWWLLKWLGCPSVQVLNGGLKAWVEYGGVLSTVIPTSPAVAPWVLPEPAMPTVNCQAVLDNLSHPSFTVIDARGSARFKGLTEPIDPVAGHIPSAINMPCTENLQADGRFLPLDTLRQHWLQCLEGRSPNTIVHQCGSGITACHNLFAMELVGLHGSALYPGSWSEWCSDRTRPVAVEQ